MLGALVDAGVSLERIQAAVDGLGVHGLSLTAETVRKNGFRATQIHVHCPHEHVHRHLADIVAMIESNAVLTDLQRRLAIDIFTLLATAEAKVHGSTVEKVHFHEVGAADSIADIVGSAVGWDLLGVDRVECSAIPTGCGEIRIAHGTCSVPAPATAELLTGLPIAASDVAMELTTPTGAAIVRTLVSRFGTMPSMVVERIGCGAGQRDIPTQPNLLRLFVGEMRKGDDVGGEGECLERPGDNASGGEETAKTLRMLETDIDDCPGEWIGYTCERLFDAGALDVVLVSVQMKKGRPGTRISVLCDDERCGMLESILFAETTTLGVRSWVVRRTEQKRRTEMVATPFGTVAGKIADRAGRLRFSPEYEICRRLAIDTGVPLADIYRAAVTAFETEHSSNGVGFLTPATPAPREHTTGKHE